MNVLLYFIYCVMLLFTYFTKEEEPRPPNPPQPISHYDPLDLDSEDLYVKYKVTTTLVIVVIYFYSCLCHLLSLWCNSVVR